MHAAHKFDKVKAFIFSNITLLLLFWGPGVLGFGLVFGNAGCFYFVTFGHRYWEMRIFSPTKGIHLDIFGIVAPINTSSANGDTDLHLSPFMLSR